MTALPEQNCIVLALDHFLEGLPHSKTAPLQQNSLLAKLLLVWIQQNNMPSSSPCQPHHLMCILCDMN